MEYQLDQLYQKVKGVSTNYSKFKGEFIANSEPVINKDMLVFKLDRVQRYKEKQDALLSNLPRHEDGIGKNTTNL